MNRESFCRVGVLRDRIYIAPLFMAQTSLASVQVLEKIFESRWGILLQHAVELEHIHFGKGAIRCHSGVIGLRGRGGEESFIHQRGCREYRIYHDDPLHLERATLET